MKINKGFTLIELLVVVAVISLLSSIVMSSVSAARSRAEETRIVQSIRSFQQALEMYKNEKGKYPQNVMSVGFTNGVLVFQGAGNGSDFQNFSKYMDIEKAFKTNGIKDFLIDYRPYVEWSYPDDGFSYNFLFFCGNPSGNDVNLYNHIKNQNGYTIILDYKNSHGGIFDNLKRAWLIYEIGGGEWDYEEIQAVIPTFYNHENQACFSSYQI